MLTVVILLGTLLANGKIQSLGYWFNPKALNKIKYESIK